MKSGQYLIMLTNRFIGSSHLMLYYDALHDSLYSEESSRLI